MGGVKHKESGGQYKEDYTVSGMLFACDHGFATAITFSLILQRNKQRSCVGSGGNGVLRVPRTVSRTDVAKNILLHSQSVIPSEIRKIPQTDFALLV